MEAANHRRPFEIERPLRINGYDIDVGGVVSNIVYVRWLEDMRMQVLDTYFPFEDQLREGFGPIVMETHIHYRRALTIFDRPVGHMWMKDVGRMRWIIAAEITLGGDVVASAEQTGTFVTYDTRRPVRMPERLRALWAQMQAEG